jgi:FKBP-type peptidyl-prolyl cis-trans isomerase SlyD
LNREFQEAGSIENLIMKTNPRVITFHFTLTDRNGRTLDSSADQAPLSFLEGIGQIFPKLEESLVKMKVGEKGKIDLAEGEGFGLRDEKKVVKIERSRLPQKEIKVGDRFQADDGQSNIPVPLTVIGVSESHATLDGNHPLASVKLTFDVEITEIRDATDEELEHGHAHGPHGHHH